MRAIVRAFGCAALAGAAFLASAGPAAGASSWKAIQLWQAPKTLFGMSCPSESLCVGVGNEGALVWSVDPTGGAPAWQVARVPEAGEYSGNLRSVSCPSTSFCAAVDFKGAVLTTSNPTGGPEAWALTPVAADHLNHIDCPSPAYCVAVSGLGQVVTSSDPTGGSGAWSAVQLPGIESMTPGVGTLKYIPLHDVSCPTPALCVSVGFNDIAASLAPDGGPGAWQVSEVTGLLEEEIALDCPSAAFCITGDAGHVRTSASPTAPAATWPAVSLATRFSWVAFECPSQSLCVATSDNGEVAYSTDPAGTQDDWLVEQPIDGFQNGLFGLSCPTESLCVASGAGGQIVASTDPAGLHTPGAGRDAPPPNTVLFGKPVRRLKLKPRRSRAGIRFHFTADGVFTSFQCSLGHRRFRPCKAPRGYRLKPAVYRFRVRAIGPGGPDPTPAHAEVRVSRKHVGARTVCEPPNLKCIAPPNRGRH